MRTIVLLAYCLIFISVISQAQTYKAYLKAGDNAMTTNDYYTAYTYFKTAMKIDSSDAALWYKLGRAAYEFNLFQEANYYFQKIEHQRKKVQFKDFYIYWATTKKILGDYETAAILYQKHPTFIWHNQSVIDMATACRKAQNLLKTPTHHTIRHLEKPINTPYSDFAAQKVGDAIVFSSLRFKTENQQHREIYLSKLVASKNGKKGQPIPKKFNEENVHTANSFFINNGNTVYFTRCTRTENNQLHCNIYHRERVNGRWETIKKLPPTINQTGFTATHPVVGFDSIAQTFVLFFVSDKGNTNGKLHLWSSIIEGDGRYGSPKKLAIEQLESADYITPYFHTQTQALYYSTNTMNTLGGYDIFKVKRTPKGWSKPENMASPINSGYNDVYFRINDDNKTGYLSSNRTDALTLTRGACCYDIYEFALNAKQIPPLVAPTEDTLIAAMPPKASLDTPSTIKITTISEKTGQVAPKTPPLSPTSMQELKAMLPITLYFHNDRPNPRTHHTTTQLNYATTYHNYLARLAEYRQEYTKGLVGFSKQQAQQKIDDFFFQQVQQGFQKLEVVSTYLLQRLQTGAPMEIILKGYTSPRATSGYNLNLAKRRIHSLKNYFNEFQGGVFQPYIQSGQLRLTAVAFGETTAASHISDQLSDRRNSIYSVEASRERRVEILDIR